MVQGNNIGLALLPPAQVLLPPQEALPAQAPLPQAPIPPRVHRTHSSPTVIQMLKSLSLASVLQKNKKIEAENDARALKTLAHEEDPIANPQPGSETASLITIEFENLNRLKVPSFYSSFREWIYPTFTPLEFAQSLFDTELHVAVPLPFFLNKSLQILVDEASTLPTIKSNPLPGETKGIHILDIEKLSIRFGKELSLTCSQWSEAALNMFKFQQARDKKGDDGLHASWFDDHFNFFNVHRDRDELYDAWKNIELRLRKEHRSHKTSFNPGDHDNAFREAAASHKLRLEFQGFLTASQ
ncbi:hypothetical protein BYT27DRAFT_7103707, partial [Phlegmacium glaucopus]